MILSVSNEYDIVIEPGVLQKAEAYLDLDRKVLVVTDSGVPKEYAKALVKKCKEPHLVTLPMGEESKNMDNFILLQKEMVSASFSRGDCVVAVGGGVVGDICGFAASCYMRGIDFYNIPTTLLSQLDSSIGGKTAIDFLGVKNIVGSFYKPKRVLIDPEALKTLDERQLHAGLAEAIKMAVTSDEELFSFIENSVCLTKDLPTIIERALSIKKAVVEEDFKETGPRRILNFGHTVGHAIESLLGGEWLHGECVALGMTYFSSQTVLNRLLPLLERYKLPTKADFNKDDLLPYLKRDKKAVDGGVLTVLADEIGKGYIKTLSFDELLQRI
ncbi:MAG: 3-dehydroquinate synthase [Clostridia bacterium]|nr:3-dehydroquinate synthase [Clostridia bacterium]